MSAKHVTKYVNEFTFRFNSRHCSTTYRMNFLFQNTEVRTTYKNLSMGKNKSITIEGNSINIILDEGDDYICLTDMAKTKDGDNRAADVIKNWVRNRSTIEFLGAWESIYNENFKVVEFDHFRKEAGLPTFVMSPKQWVEKTNAIGIISKAGRYGGTYAHKDIAFEFGAAISPMFKLYLIKEFQRLKELETSTYNIEWDVKRILSKVNYRIHTDAIKDYIIPKSVLAKDKQWIEYANEADILNVSLFGFTAKEWKESNPALVLNGANIRDIASINELTVLSNLESINAEMIRTGVGKELRFQRLKSISAHQLKSIEGIDIMKSLRKQRPNDLLEPVVPPTSKKTMPELSSHNQALKKMLDTKPPSKKK